MLKRFGLVICSLACLAATAQGQTPAPPAAPPAPPYAAVLGPTPKSLEGLLQVHRKSEQVFVELMPGDYSSEYLVLISLSRGIGQGQLLGGMSLNFGDDWVWVFRKYDDKVHIVRKNVRFKAKPGSPEATAVQLAYSDSVMYALPVVAEAGGNMLVDMTRVFMSDDEQIGKNFGGSFVLDRSTMGELMRRRGEVERRLEEAEARWVQASEALEGASG